MASHNGVPESELTVYIETIVAEMESRMHAKYNETLKNLETKLALARSTNERLEENVKEWSVQLTRLCEHLGEKAPCFKELAAEFSNLSVEASSKTVMDDMQEMVVPGDASVSKQDSGINEGDMVDGNLASSLAAPSLRSFGKQNVMFKCVTVEPQGKGLNDARGRFFSGIYKIDNGKEVLPVRITFIRYPDEDVEPPIFFYDFTVCFPKKQSENVKEYYGDLDISLSFLNAENTIIFSRTVSVEAGSGTCHRSADSGKVHISCDNGTAVFEDFFESYEDPRRQDMLERDGMLRRDFRENQTQCFYFKAEVDLLALSASIQGEVEINASAEPTDLEIIAYELQDLSAAAQFAVEDWRRRPTDIHLWYNDMDINIELIMFSQEQGYDSLKQQCVKNIMTVPKTIFESGCVDIDVIISLAQDCNLTELLNWAISQD